MKSVSAMGDSWLETDGVRSERTEAMSATRVERDPLGELPVPAEALYGVQTERARHNFPISHLAPLAPFVDAVIWIKKARSEEHTSELQSQSNLVCRLLLEKKNYAVPKKESYWDELELRILSYVRSHGVAVIPVYWRSYLASRSGPGLAAAARLFVAAGLLW